MARRQTVIISGCKLLAGILFLAWFALSPAASGDNSKMHALFIGNSLTFVNDLPGTVARLAQARGHDLSCDQYAPGGETFGGHASDPNALQKIKERKWEIVILQEQSQIPSFSQEQLKHSCYPFAKKLCALVRANNPKTRIIFYQTMAHKNGDPGNAKVSEELLTYDGTQKRINQSYHIMAKENRAALAPVGEAYEKVRTAHPEIELYGDETHPSHVGTYLAACVIFSTIYKESPAHLPHPPEIGAADAAYLQEAAGSVSHP